MWQLFFYKDLEERSLRLKALAFFTAGLILIFFEEYTEGFLSGNPWGPAGYTTAGQPRPLISVKIAALLSSGFCFMLIGIYYGGKADEYRKEFIEIEKELEASRTNEPVLQSKFSDSLIAALFFFGLGIFFLPFWLALPFCLFYYIWVERERPVMSDSAQSQSKILVRGEKRPSIQFTPKSFLVDIECPGCNAQMKVPELNKMQEVTCRACGLSGEIEI